MKLWDKDLKINDLVEKFTIGNDPVFDLKMAKFDVQGTLAHIEMLTEIGLLTEQELAQLKPALNHNLGIGKKLKDFLTMPLDIAKH